MTETAAPSQTTDRQAWMGLLARARHDRLVALFPDLPEHTVLRPAEVGAVMVRGRIGAVGGPFNLGEMSVTRCSVRLAGGAVGHAYVQGRDKDHARRAAVLDALMQTGQGAQVLEALATEETTRKLARAEKAAATKVDFFTLVRGENG